MNPHVLARSGSPHDPKLAPDLIYLVPNVPFMYGPLKLLQLVRSTNMISTLNCPKMLRFSMLEGLDASGINHRSRSILWTIAANRVLRVPDAYERGTLELVQKTWPLDLCLMNLALAIFFSLSLSVLAFVLTQSAHHVFQATACHCSSI